MNVEIRLKNPPAGANRWGLSLYDWSGVKVLGTTVYSVDGVAVFDIPSDWLFPLRFWISIIYYPDGNVTVLHEAQSKSPIWPNYVEEFIPDYGSYYYNVATRKFEALQIIDIMAPGSAQQGATVNISVTVRNIQPYGYRFKMEIHKVPDIYPSELIRSVTESILSGASKAYTASFAMPDCNVTVLVWVETEIGVTWQYYSSASKVVALAVPEPGISDMAVSSFSKV